ncbi:MAG: ACP S-malonyltransferase, partial [Paracoccus sp. (in: a-proteobacteria)]|nr:ACP S-malonyltransferase [Paracoccus sp. (in: a-proteobacteria)]
LSDTARLLRLRGQAMQEAVPVGIGAMAAILGLDFETVDRIARDIGGDEVVQAANDNDPGQVVISGHKGAVEQAMAAMKEAGAKRALLLPVSAPFHSVLMQPAAAVMADALAGVDIQAPAVPLIANVRAEPVIEPGAIRRLLVEQVTGTVRWRESMANLAEGGVTEFWEIGAGKALSGMIKRIVKDAAVRNIGAPADIAALKA